MFWNPIFTQSIYYMITMLFGIMAIAFMQKGFFFAFLKVKLSFGKYILVEMRETPSYSYRVGWTEGGFLKFKDKREKRKFMNRIALPGKKAGPDEIRQVELPKGRNIFYKTMDCWRVDVDPETNAILEKNLEGIQSYDPVKFDELCTQIMEAQQPSKEHIILIGLVIVGIGVGVAIYFLYNNTNIMEQLPEMCSQCAQCTKATVPAPAAG